jgi:hypothetical protein
LPLPRRLLLAFLAGMLVAVAMRAAVPLARACALVPFVGTFDLTLDHVRRTAGILGTTQEAEAATWPATATLNADLRRVDFPDGTALEFEEQ